MTYLNLQNRSDIKYFRKITYLMVTLSVVIPSLNEREYISDLLETVENQEFDDYEVIVCDGGSEDGTVDVAKDFGARVITDDGEGPGAARNKGAKKAKGKYLLFLDSDVKLLHEKVFDKVVNVLEENQDIVGGTSTWKVHDANLRASIGYKLSSKIFYTVNALDIQPAAVGTFMFVRKEIFKAVGGFDESLPFHEDHDLFERLEEQGETVCLSNTHSTSGRRVVENGLLPTMKTYFVPSFYYLIGKEDEMKEKFGFETVGD